MPLLYNSALSNTRPCLCQSRTCLAVPLPLLRIASSLPRDTVLCLCESSRSAAVPLHCCASRGHCMPSLVGALPWRLFGALLCDVSPLPCHLKASQGLAFALLSHAFAIRAARSRAIALRVKSHNRCWTVLVFALPLPVSSSRLPAVPSLCVSNRYLAVAYISFQMNRPFPPFLHWPKPLRAPKSKASGSRLIRMPLISYDLLNRPYLTGNPVSNGCIRFSLVFKLGSKSLLCNDLAN